MKSERSNCALQLSGVAPNSKVTPFSTTNLPPPTFLSVPIPCSPNKLKYSNISSHFLNLEHEEKEELKIKLR